MIYRQLMVQQRHCSWSLVYIGYSIHLDMLLEL